MKKMFRSYPNIFMKKKHVVALAVAVLFIGIAAFALVDNKIDYSDFDSARGTGKRVQVL
jgi:hypothetical protein